MRVTRPSTSLVRRTAACMWRQRALTPVCPETPRLDGKLALVTGGNGGIGLETARGLARRGADIVIAARNEATGRRACDEIAQQTGAQTSLYCATQADVPAGAYVHNCLGRMELSQDDPASDALKAAELWRRCDRLVASYL